MRWNLGGEELYVLIAFWSLHGEKSRADILILARRLGHRLQ